MKTMTKRPSPFETNICRQSKIHFNNYENDLNALKNLEEQTFKKLMEGSKKSHLRILNNGSNINEENEAHHKNTFWQKRVSDYFTVNGKKIKENSRILINPRENLSRCFFCDIATSSVYQCIQCLEFYCRSCSFVKYDLFEDKRICMSCS